MNINKKYLDNLVTRLTSYCNFIENSRKELRDNYGTDIDLKARLLGLSSEVGEVQDLFKKNIELGREIPRDRLVEELGDTLYYLISVSNMYGIGYDELMSFNINKLLDRGICKDKESEYRVLANKLLSHVSRNTHTQRLGDHDENY